VAPRHSKGRLGVRVVYPPALRFARTRLRSAPKVAPSVNIGRATRAIGPPENSSSSPDGDSPRRCAYASNACPVVWPGVAQNINPFRHVLWIAGTIRPSLPRHERPLEKLQEHDLRHGRSRRPGRSKDDPSNSPFKSWRDASFLEQFIWVRRGLGGIPDSRTAPDSIFVRLRRSCDQGDL
jgi:hypothetical protein